MGQKLDLGPIFCSSAPLPLTESETEYVVTCVKHTYKEHILFQFDIINTLNDQVRECKGVNFFQNIFFFLNVDLKKKLFLHFF